MNNRLSHSSRHWTVTGMNDPARLLAAYDDQLHTDAQTPGAVSVTGYGPPRLVPSACARGLAVDGELPEGVPVRRGTEEAGGRALSATEGEVCGDPVSDEAASALR